MTFLTPLALLGLLTLLPILALYILRLRRREVVVSNHFLWQRVLRDAEANTPFQRLRRSLLLWLQLLLVCLLVLALVRPAVLAPTLNAGRVVVLLDASASMNAINSDGRTRFEQAQAETLALIGRLGVGDAMAIWRVGDSVTPLSEWTTNPNQLRDAVQSASVGQGRADWDTALTLAIAGVDAETDFALVLVTDGGIGAVNALPSNIPQPQVISVGDTRDNLAITALGVRPEPRTNGTSQLFAQITHYGSATVTVDVALRLDGVLWQSQAVTLQADSQTALVVQIDRPFNTVQASLVLPAGVADALASDNQAWAVADGNAVRRVLVISTNEARFITQALTSLPNVQVFRGDASRATLPQQGYDAYVFDGYLPETLPTAGMWLIHPPRATSLFTLDAPTESTLNPRLVDETHPLTLFLDVSALNVRRLTPMRPTVEAIPLASVDGGTFLWAIDNGAQKIAILPFALADSDLPLQIAFPIVMANSLAWFTPPTRMSADTALEIGASLALSLPLTADGVRVTAPDGTSYTLERNANLTQTERVGLYELTAFNADGDLLQQFVAVNLFDRAESDITPRTPALNVLGGSPPITDSVDEGWREGWGVVVLLALTVMMGEWWVYHRQFRAR